MHCYVIIFTLNKDERARLLKECHNGPTSGHLGTKRTLARVTERFMWPGVGKDVNNVVSTYKTLIQYSINKNSAIMTAPIDLTSGDEQISTTTQHVWIETELSQSDRDPSASCSLMGS